MSIVDLPLDILDIIFSYLDPKSFLAFCSTCQILHAPDVRSNSTYWRRAIQTTFRVPNRPAAQGNGPRWQQLYERLRTQSRVYTWGNSDHGALGQTPPRLRISGHTAVPDEMGGSRAVGTIADMQAGGWSTALLNSQGQLYIVGKIDRLRAELAPRPPRLISARQEHLLRAKLRPLVYPAGFAAPETRWEPGTAIRQFSSGRAHILGLSDSGKVWSWDHDMRPGLQVKFLHFDVREQGGREHGATSAAGTVRKVVAGWDKSSAYVTGKGILIWDVAHVGSPDVPQDAEDAQDPVDTVLIEDAIPVPSTWYQRPRGRAREPDAETQALGEEVGEVVNWVVLENYIVVVTDIGKAFTAKITWGGNQPPSISPLLLISALQSSSTSSTSTSSPSSSTDPTAARNEEQEDPILDVQGAFRRFAVFTAAGAVLLASTPLLALTHDSNPDAVGYPTTSLVPIPPPTPARIPALQHTGVVALAFGDYHMHALHASGHITSYGTEPSGCGALGLGHHGEAALRGVRGPTLRGAGVGAGPAGLVLHGDGKLLRQCYHTGRRVWFAQEKREWVRYIAYGRADPAEAVERMAMVAREERVQAEVSEWVEQRGNLPCCGVRKEGQGESEVGKKEGEEDEALEMEPYFALSVTAAGWHSGALVLVNEERARRDWEACIVKDEEHLGRGGASSSQTEADASTEQRQQHQRTFDNGQYAITAVLAFLFSAARRLASWFLGLPLLGVLELPPDVQQQQPDESSGREGPGPGFKFIWADEPFPRLRLSDGREMPGRVEFAEWVGERVRLEVPEDMEF